MESAPSERASYSYSDFLLAIEPLVKEFLRSAIDSRKPVDYDSIADGIAPLIAKKIEPLIIRSLERRVLGILVSVGLVPVEILADYDKQHASREPERELDIGAKALGELGFSPLG